MFILTVIAYLAPVVIAAAYIQDMRQERKEAIYAKVFN